jgi:hypothetical protein
MCRFCTNQQTLCNFCPQNLLRRRRCNSIRHLKLHILPDSCKDWVRLCRILIVFRKIRHQTSKGIRTHMSWPKNE